MRHKLSTSAATYSIAISALLLLTPLLFSSNTALNFITQVCITAVFALSFNLLLGQTGLLSFGHAVYSGLGAFAAIHAMNKISAGNWAFPISLVPLVAGLAGLFFAALFGWLSSKKSGLTFSMISLGIGELVFAGAAMFPTIFGGEGGISANRVTDTAWLGISFGPQIEITYLVIIWTLLAAGAMFFLRLTPLGKLALAVRENPERLAFLGFDPRWVRFLMLCISGFFAGIAGGLSALHFEIATTDNLSMLRSGSVLLFTYIGGISLFLGPVLGALLAIVMSIFLSEITPAWQLYLGVLFMLLVSFAPQGMSGLFVSYVNAIKIAIIQDRRHIFIKRSLAYFTAAGLLCSGAVMLVELLYRWRFPTESFKEIILFGVHFYPQNMSSWASAILMLTFGFFSVLILRRSQR
ncbi:MAG: branched-chain amino acid ABC transporter permease [Candidatus Aquirickettsiella gammari]